MHQGKNRSKSFIKEKSSRKKSFQKSFQSFHVMSHNAEVKLSHLQFAEAFNGTASCKIFCPSFIFHHFTINCIWLFFLPAWDTMRCEEFSERSLNSFLISAHTFYREPKIFWGGLAPLAPLVARLSMNVKLGTFESSLAVKDKVIAT